MTRGGWAVRRTDLNRAPTRSASGHMPLAAAVEDFCSEDGTLDVAATDAFNPPPSSSGARASIVGAATREARVRCGA